MELKLCEVCPLPLPAGVLIEPLWNWNERKTEETRPRATVLIEPLWNWNHENYEQSKIESVY